MTLRSFIACGIALIAPRVALPQTAASPALAAAPHTVVVDTATVLNSFAPTKALGAGIDRLPAGAFDRINNPEARNKILSAGWQPVTYRQNTELFVEAWHWNPEGTWSDPSGNGYFTASARSSQPIRQSYGYLLPHRGFTRNDGTGAVGYSRLTDGDLNTYWKSNPYLTKAFTGEDDSLHPQWVLIDLANNQLIDAIRIAWAEPYARHYEVQYFTGDDPIHHATRGSWVLFPGGGMTSGTGGTTTLRLAPAPMPVRFLRIWMTESSNTCDTHGATDKRNCVGYAIRELYLGTAAPDGKFYDLVRHAPDQDQTTTYCSSVDPWHEPTDLDPLRREQVGFDLFFTSGYTRGLPAMVPVAMLYDIPESAANEIAYLKQRGYPVSYIEMGEEPDGQYMLPEDYAALYLQWATAIHKVDPAAKLGGPVFQGVNEDIEVWPDSHGRSSWTGRFIDYLKAHGRLADLSFFSFEHYPLEPCKIQWSSLYDEPRLVRHIVDVWHADGVPPGVPLIISESNIDWQGSENSVNILGALWLADYMASFLTAGGDSVYFFHYIPLGLQKGCSDSMGTFGLFTVDAAGQPQQPLSQYFASQMLNLEWVQPSSGIHKVFPATTDITDEAGNLLVTAYALQRPDGQWSIMLINKDQENPHQLRIALRGGVAERSLAGSVSVITFGPDEYRWHPTATGGAASPDGPLAKSTVDATGETLYALPAASITVIRGKATL